jgi:hypothetical protein
MVLYMKKYNIKYLMKINLKIKIKMKKRRRCEGLTCVRFNSVFKKKKKKMTWFSNITPDKSRFLLPGLHMVLVGW